MPESLLVDDKIPEEVVQCKKCKLTSILPELFYRQTCPRCLSKNTLRNSKLLYSAILLIFLGDLLINGFTLNFSERLSHMWAALFVLSIFFVFCHELCHALAAKLLGGTVFSIEVGIGSELFHRWFNNVLFRIRVLPVSGFCYAGFRSLHYIRIKYAIFTTAGLMFHLITVVTLLIIRRQSIIFSTLIYDLINLTIWLNAMIFVVNFIPRKYVTSVGRINNDGKTLLELLQGKLTPNKIVQGFYVNSARFAFQRNDFEALEKTATVAVDMLPDNAFTKNLSLYLLLHHRRIDEARLGWEQIIDNELDTIEERAIHSIMYNNLAWCELLGSRDSGDIELAYEHAEIAYSMTPWISEMAGTFGAANAVAGNYDQGIQLAEEALSELRRLKPPQWEKYQAIHLATIALAHFKQNNFEQVKEFLAKAIELDDDDMWVEQVAVEINSQPLIQ